MRENETIKNTNRKNLVLVSTEQEDSLTLVLERLQIAIQKKNYTNQDLDSICYTLQVGREALRYRVAILTDSISDLYDKLDCLKQGKMPVEGVYHSEFNRQLQGESTSYQQEQIEEALCQYQLTFLAKAWINEAVIDWSKLYQGRRMRIISLPTYLFQKTKYSIKDYLVSPKQQESKNQCELTTYEELWIPETYEVKKEAATGRLYAICSSDLNLLNQAKEEAMKQFPSARWIAIPITQERDYEVSFQDIKKQGKKCDGILDLCQMESIPSQDVNLRVFSLLQAINTTDLQADQIVVAGEYEDLIGRCRIESLIGIERSLHLSLPTTKFRVVFREKQLLTSQWFAYLIEEVWNGSGESVFVEEGTRKVSRLKELSYQPEESLLQEKGIYLITGGSGKIAGLLANWLRESYDAEVILASRNVNRIHCLDDRVHAMKMDVCDETQVMRGITSIVEAYGRIDGIFHASGLEGSENLLQMEYSRFQSILAPKIEGTLHLEKVVEQYPVRFLCYFSSIATIVGDSGSCCYAMGNRFMDCLVQNHPQKNTRRIGINWPLWKEGGMHIGANSKDDMYLKLTHQEYLQTKDALEFLKQVMKSKQRQCVLFCNQRGKMHPLLEQRLNADSSKASIRRKVEANVEECQTANIRQDFMTGWSAKQCVLWELDDMVADLLCITKDKINHDKDIEAFGFDSIELAKFASRISKRFGIRITPDLFFSYSTINAIQAYLMKHYEKEILAATREKPINRAFNEAFTTEKPNRSEEKEQEVREQEIKEQKEKEQEVKEQQGKEEKVKEQQIIEKEATQQRKIGYGEEKIAVIGMSGRFPSSYNIKEFWQHIVKGEDVICNVAEHRASWKNGMSAEEIASENFGKIGEIPGVAQFDPLFFEISPKDAKAMDPKQRLLLEEAWKALEDAGLGKSALQKHTIGMFVGVEDGDYQNLLGDNSQILANHNSVLAARLGYILNFKGPNMAINTACSSGLVALHEACLSLNHGECDVAIVAGVSILATCQSYRGMKKAGMLSDDGCCRAFDKKANGMIPAEAVAVVVLMKKNEAVKERYNIHASLLGSELKFDGRTNGITAPNGEAQTQLLQNVYRKHGVDPERVGYIVAHGTGTKLGDPIEINALNRAFQSMTNKNQFCAVTSIKPNIGHALAASGIVNLIALIMAMKDKIIPKSIHCEEINEYIDWNDSPFYLNRETKEWIVEEGQTRIGGVSAFGMSGTNVHLIVEEEKEAKEQKNQDDSDPYYLLVFSGKTKTALRNRMKELAEDIKTASATYDLKNLAYTLYSGRMHFNDRCAVVVPKTADVASIIFQASKEEKFPNVYYGVVDKNFEKNFVIEQSVVELTKKAKESRSIANQYLQYLQGIAEYYCTGYEEALEEFFCEPGSITLHLPTYPFDHKDYWVEAGKPSLDNETMVAAAMEVQDQGMLQEDTYVEVIETKDSLVQTILHIVSGILQIDENHLASAEDLCDYGFSSIGYVELAESLNEAYSIDITPDLFYSHKTVDSVADYLRSTYDCFATEEHGLKLNPEIQAVRPSVDKTCAIQLEAQLQGNQLDSLEEVVLSNVKHSLASMLELEENTVDDEENLAAYGLDSIGMVEFAGMLSEQYHLFITPDVLFNHPTISKLTNYLLDQYGEQLRYYERQNLEEAGKKEEELLIKNITMQEPKNQDDLQQRKDAIAIVGMSGKFPGADTVEELWDILAEGKSMIHEISSKRVEWQSTSSKKKEGKTRRIGEVSHIDEFDPLFFEISPLEAERMDPRQRLLLEELWKAIEDAGYGKEELSNDKIGIFVGAEDGEYKKLTDDEMIVSNHNAVLAARLAYFLDFKGPNMTINTACSSGLVALHEACQSLRNEECDTAIVAACNLLITPESYDIMEKNGMLSEDGTCYAFDERANGMVPSEAIAVLILKKLPKAQQWADYIYATIEASGINYDGKTNGITAPNGQSQAELIQEIYHQYQIDPEKISYVVTHGTGTKLGDPIEFNALTQAYRAFTDKSGYCAITSTKPNLGHSMAASGLVSLISLVLAMQHEMIPASIHYEVANPYCNWKDSPFYVNTKNRVWKDEGADNRFAAVSAFGLSGTNAHVVLQSYPQVTEEAEKIEKIEKKELSGQRKIKDKNTEEPYLFIFSAKSEQSLRGNLQKASELSFDFVERHLRNISYTLLKGRLHFEYRIAFVACSANEFFMKIEDALKDFHRTGLCYGRCYTKRKVDKAKLNEAKRVAEQCQSTRNQEKKLQLLQDLASYYCEGMEDACIKLWETESVYQVKLPTYSFENESYWLNLKDQAEKVVSQISYWLHKNCSDFNSQVFRSTYTATDYMLRDHIIQGKRTIPGAVYLEIARNAISYSTRHQGPMILKDIGFVQPAVLKEESLELEIELVQREQSEIQFQISSANEGKESLYCMGSGIPIQFDDTISVDLEDLKQVCNRRIPIETCYEEYRRIQMEFQGAFCILQEMYAGENQILTRIASTITDHSEKGSYIYPEMLDGAFQSTIGFYINQQKELDTAIVPFAIKEVRILRPCTTNMWAVLQMSETETELVKFDMALCDEEGKVCITIIQYASKKIEKHEAVENRKKIEKPEGIEKPEEIVSREAVENRKKIESQDEIENQNMIGSQDEKEIYEAHWKESRDGLSENAPVKRIVMAYNWDELLVQLQFEQEQIQCEQLNANGKETVEKQYERLSIQILEFLQKLFREKVKEKTLLQVILKTNSKEFALGGLSGLLKTAELENPNLVVQLIQVFDSMPVTQAMETILSEDGSMKQVCYEVDKRLVKTWEVVNSSSKSTIPLRENGNYVITGGLGGLGLVLADAIVASGKKVKILLLGRSSISKEKIERVEQLRKQGCMVQYQQIDITDVAAVTQCLHDFSQQYGGIHGVFHCAGQIKDQYILKKEKKEFIDVLSPKVIGLSNIDEATKDEALDFIICYSSTSGCFGNAGQCDYAAANAYMNEYMQKRSKLSQSGQCAGRSIAISWPLWMEGGMQVTDEIKSYMYEISGLLPLTNSEGIQALSTCMNLDANEFVVMKGTKEQYRHLLE